VQRQGKEAGVRGAVQRGVRSGMPCRLPGLLPSPQFAGVSVVCCRRPACLQRHAWRAYRDDVTPRRRTPPPRATLKRRAQERVAARVPARRPAAERHAERSAADVSAASAALMRASACPPTPAVTPYTPLRVRRCAQRERVAIFIVLPRKVFAPRPPARASTMLRRVPFSASAAFSTVHALACCIDETCPPAHAAMLSGKDSRSAKLRHHAARTPLASAAHSSHRF